MREIKFRAEKKTGGYVYLDLRDLLAGGETGCIFINNASEVKLETLAQLIGVDKNEQEVYEGDKVIRIAGEDFEAEEPFPMTIADFAGIRDEEEEPFQATFEDFAAIRDGEIVKVS